MRQNDRAGKQTLAEVRQDFEPDRLMVRYCRGRVAHFVSRQVMTFCGGAVLGIMNGPMLGVLAILVALLGEAVDCLFLRSVPGRLARGDSFRLLYRLSTLTALFQALTISACIALAWIGEVSREAPLFAMAFLAGAVVNAGLVLPYHKGAALARLILYGLVAVLYHKAEALVRGPTDGEFLMNAMGTLILGNMAYSFLASVGSGFNRNRNNLLAITDQGEALEQANAQLVLHQKEAHQLSLVAKNANDSVILSDSQGRIFWVNDAFSRITGYTLEEAVGRTASDLLNGAETSGETIRLLRLCVEEGRPFRGEIQNRTRDGRDIWIETNQVPLPGDDGRTEMVIAIERDITQAKETARELARAKRKAEDGARAKAEFLATMSHEIRTPMNGVIGMADLMNGTGLNDEQQLYCDTIRSSAQALLTIINDILDLSKLDANKMELSKVDFDLRTCVGDSIRLLRAQAQDKNLSLDLEMAANLPTRIHSDDGRLRQVLINLIGNAIKFTETGGVRIGVTVEPGPVIVIDVTDTGIGIAEDKLSRVFERFSQADSATTRQFGGTGLGLTISRMLVEAMGGEISVTSTVGVGSRFRVRLPVVLAQSAEQAPLASRAETPGLEALHGKRVLVAEDNRVNRLLIEKFLVAMPLELHFAVDGREVVDATRALSPDIVLMDMSMPGMSGIEATRAIRSAEVSQPVIVALTANAFESDRRACLEAGMDGFLSKPVRRDQLLAAMVQHLCERVEGVPL